MQQPAATHSKYVFYSACSFCLLCHLYPTPCRSSFVFYSCSFFFQAEDSIRDAQESRGLGDVSKRQPLWFGMPSYVHGQVASVVFSAVLCHGRVRACNVCIQRVP